MSKKLQVRLEKYLESKGAEKAQQKAQYGYTHILKTKIGMLWLKVDTEGSLVSIFGNFLNNPEEAKKLVGHWKYNLHVSKKDPNIEQCIDYHLSKVL